jgi:CheY-like chemotaxis protein
MKILVAEDEDFSRQMLQGHLEQLGHEVVAASNGLEAWALFRLGDFPLVITDWMMPELDGLELVRRIRSQNKSAYVYIILLTSSRGSWKAPMTS